MDQHPEKAPAVTEPIVLADYTTFRTGGPAADHVTADTTEKLVDAVRSADAEGVDVLLVAGGSNMVVTDFPLDERVVLVRTNGINVVQENDKQVTVRVEAGTVWDEFVSHTVNQGWAGIEALSGIPGSTGATPIQNVGAYGQDVSQTISCVHTFDRETQEEAKFAAADCKFEYRNSVFKANPGRYLVTAVDFTLQKNAASPVAYSQLAQALNVELGTPVAVDTVRSTVLGLRASKGMVLDDDDHDTWSAGSFFTNPIVAEKDVPEGAPAWPVSNGLVKTSAAWLIDHAGFSKGFGKGRPARLSTKHTLALTNRGQATTSDVLALAAVIREGVHRAYGITLVPEPNFIHCAIPD